PNRSACSGRRRHRPSRSPHARKRDGRTKGDIDTGVREEWSCGRSQTLLYNLDRPHQALDQNVPASRYQPSTRPMPDRLPKVEYDQHEIVRSVSTTKAYVSFKGRLWKVPQAFRGERLAIRPLSTDGRYGVFFAARQVASIDLTNPQPVSHVSEQV